MSNELIVITGATGTVGSEVAKSLLAAGARVRVAVRNPAKVADLVAAGAEATPVDFADPTALERAFSGAARLFLLTPFVEDDVAQVQAAVEAAKRAGVRFVLRMSALGADPDSPLELGRKHARAEQIVKDSGLEWTVLQPTFFQDNVFNYAGSTITEQGAFYGASGGGKTAYVSSADIGAVAAKILEAPQGHAGQTHVVTGPEALADTEVAALLTKALGKAVRYVDLDNAAYRRGVLDTGAPEWMADALAGLEGVKANGWAAAVSPVVFDVLGRAPESMAAFLARHRNRLV